MSSNNTHAPVSAALAEAQNILRAAEEKANRIILRAEEESEQIRNEAYEKGITLGKQQVVASAIQAIKEQSEIKNQLEEVAAKLAYDILDHVFSLKNTDILNPIKELAKKMVLSIPSGSVIELVFNEAHAEALDVIKTDLEELSRGSSLHLKPSLDTPMSSILIRTDFGEIHVSMKEFFEEITKQMKLLPTDAL